MEVRWIVPDPASAVTGGDLLRAATESDAVPTFAWVAGEQALATAMRRHWVRIGVPKRSVSFTGYWRAPRGH